MFTPANPVVKGTMCSTGDEGWGLSEFVVPLCSGVVELDTMESELKDLEEGCGETKVRETGDQHAVEVATSCV